MARHTHAHFTKPSRRTMPRAHAGMRIGLLGGSFDPAHMGHAHVARTALQRLDLDAVWWLVSPQNPLKKSSSPIEKRLASARMVARRVANGRRMVVTDVESRLNTQFTIDTLLALKHLYRGVHFVWLMGGDNLRGFERWRGWAAIARAVPMCVVSRPPTHLATTKTGQKARGVHMGKLSTRFGRHRIAEEAARLLPNMAAPAWTYITARRNPESSTRLRQKGAGLG